jgi:hypothetical protein
MWKQCRIGALPVTVLALLLGSSCMNEEAPCEHSLCLPVALAFKFLDSTTTQAVALDSVFVVYGADTAADFDSCGFACDSLMLGRHSLIRDGAVYRLTGGAGSYDIIVYDRAYGNFRIDSVVVAEHEYENCGMRVYTTALKIRVTKQSGLPKRGSPGSFTIVDEFT